jgi:hypothetical protein
MEVDGYQPEQPLEFGIELIRTLLRNPNSWGALAVLNGKVLGSIFIFLHKLLPSPVVVIGPLTVRPSAEGGIGRALMIMPELLHITMSMSITSLARRLINLDESAFSSIITAHEKI